ncbi:MAG: DUF6273 domain-containing protein [Bacilli bacterium]
MKKNIQNILLIITILILCTFIVLFSINYLNTDKIIIKSSKEQKQSNNSLALMYETTPETGEYQVSTDSAWPSTGYTFNSTLSKCENGSALTYDATTNKVKVQSTKSDKCYIYFDKNYLLPVVNSITENNVTSNSIAITVNTTVGTNPIKNYYFSNDNGITYVSTTSNNYTFSGLSVGTTYNVKIKVEDIISRYSEIFSKTVTTIGSFVTTLKSNYSTLGMDCHNGLANGANDNSYRFSGANPNNYVCFGPGATAAGQACPEENQYRIIGVFGDQVKLIKKISLGKKVWNSYELNTWTGSIMEKYLNGDYLTTLTPIWSNKIVTNTWQVGGMSEANGSAVPATVYNYEVGPNKANETFNGKIGLMYVSDYGFAASPSNWILKLYDEYKNCTANNWLFLGDDEWTISKVSSLGHNAFVIKWSGFIIYNYANFINGESGTRPSFYLQPSVNLNGGNGTAIDPYRV